MNVGRTKILFPYMAILVVWFGTHYWCIDLLSRSIEYWPPISLLCRYAVMHAFRPNQGSLSVQTDKYSRQMGVVTIEPGISIQEQEYLKLRKPIVQKALSELLPIPVASDSVPTVALLGSGGGYRALLWMLGVCVELEALGLLDTVTYASGLSGTGWFLASYMQRSSSMKELKGILLDNIGVNKDIFRISLHDKKTIFGSILPEKSCLYGPESNSLTDLYGALVANQLFSDLKDRRFDLYLSTQSDRLQDGSTFFPLYMAAERTDYGYNSYEFNPYRVKDLTSMSAIPSWAYGRRFKEGLSINRPIEQRIAFLLGTFGSAFSVSLERGWKEYLKDLEIENPTDMSIGHKILDAVLIQKNKEMIPIKGTIIPNFMYGFLPAGNQSEKRFIRLIDPNVEKSALNFSYQPLSMSVGGRSIDVMIFLDASRFLEQGSNLRKVELYAREKGDKFPPIDYTDIDKKSMSVFIDQNDPTVPIVIYIPRIVDLSITNSSICSKELCDEIKNINFENEVENGAYRTVNFSYSKKQAELLCTLAEYAVYTNEQLLLKTLSQSVKRKEIVHKAIIE